MLYFQVHSSLLRWLIPSADVTIASRDLSKLPLDIYAHVTLLCCSKNNIKKTQIRTPLLDIDNDMYSDDSLPVSVVYSLNSYDSDSLLQFSKSQKIDIIGELKEAILLFDYLVGLKLMFIYLDFHVFSSRKRSAKLFFEC